MEADTTTGSDEEQRPGAAPAPAARWLAICPERAVLIAAVVAAVVLFGILAQPLLTGRVIAIHDPGWLYLPLNAYYSQCLERGDSFDWMPQFLGGYFISAEGEEAMFHPLHWLMYRWLPLKVAFQLDIVLPVLIALSGLTWFLRRYVGFAAALAGSMLFAFSVKFVWHLEHPPMVMVVAHIPWLLGAMDAAMTATSLRRRCFAGSAIAFLIGSAFLFGFAQSLWFLLLSDAAFCIYLFFSRQRTWGGWLAVAAGNLLGLCMGAVQLLTMAVFTLASDRTTADPDFPNIGALWPRNLVGSIAPYLMFGKVPGWWGIYFGTVPLVLAVWWLGYGMWTPGDIADPNAANRSRQLRRLSIFAAVYGIVALWMSLGFAGKIYYLQTYLPLVGKLRCPDRFHMLTTMAIAIFAGMALARLLTLARRRQLLPWTSLILPWSMVFAATAVAGVFVVRGMIVPTHGFQSKVWSAPLLFGAAAVGLTLASRGRRAGVLLLVVLAAIDLGLYAVGNDHVRSYWSPKRTMTWQQYLATASKPPSANEGRLWDNILEKDVHWLNGYRLINGYIGGMDPLRRLDYTHVNTLRVAEVAWFRDVWHPQLQTPGLTPASGGDWRRVPNPLPRARLVSNVVASDVPGEDLKTLDVDRVALVTHAMDLSAAPPGRATIVEDRPGSIKIEVSAPNRQLLALAESFDAGWQVAIDGRRAALERVNGDFMGCVVESGDHRAEFAFRPASLWWGKLISGTGAALGIGWLGLTLVGGFGTRRTPQDSNL